VIFLFLVSGSVVLRVHATTTTVTQEIRRWVVEGVRD
jgi:hypothetical protein